MINENFLIELDFTKTGEITEKNKRLEYESQLKQDKKPGIYLWCKRENKDNLEVKYVGKAGNGVSARMGQHIGGLSRPSAETRAEFIKEQFGIKKENAHENCIEVWFRKSPEISFENIFNLKKNFDPVGVSQYSLEEEALITHFNPILNRAKTPALREQNKSKSKKSDAIKFDDLDQIMCEANGEQRDSWTNAIQYITAPHKEEIAKALNFILKLLESNSSDGNTWPTDLKFIATDTRPVLAGKPLLVLGRVKDGKMKFDRGSKIVFISLKKDYPTIYFFGKIIDILPKYFTAGKEYNLSDCINKLS